MNDDIDPRAAADRRYEHCVQGDALIRAAEETLKEAQWHYKHAGSSVAAASTRSARDMCWAALRMGNEWRTLQRKESGRE